MEWIKSLLFVMGCLAIGSIVLVLLPILHIVGTLIVIFFIGYAIIKLKDYDPEKHNPFK